MQKIIIDGYNVMYADSEVRRIIRKDLERARRLFIDKVKRYLEEKMVSATIVFDGKGGMVDASPILPGKLQVVFTKEDETADEFIVASIQAAANPKEYIVVTSDKEDIAGRAKECGASVISSGAFLSRLQAKIEREKKEPEKPRTEHNFDYWMDKFTKKDRE